MQSFLYVKIWQEIEVGGGGGINLHESNIFLYTKNVKSRCNNQYIINGIFYQLE